MLDDQGSIIEGPCKKKEESKNDDGTKIQLNAEGDGHIIVTKIKWV